MRNFKVSIDLSDVYLELAQIDIREYTKPFMLVFVEADNPDEACIIVARRILKAIMQQGDTVDNRVLCRKTKRTMRIEKIESL